MSVNQFPIVLSTGAIARYPLARLRTYSTRTVKFADFSEQRAAQIATPVMTWDITMSQLLDSEFNDCQAFYDAQQGSNGTFTFLDPYENLLAYSEQFENAAWGLGTGTLIGQNYLLQSQNFSASPWSSANCSISTNTVAAPDGTITADTLNFTATGLSAYVIQAPAFPVIASMPITNSVWLRVASGTATLTIYLESAPGTFIATSNITVTTSWQRFSVSGTMASGSSAVNFAIGNPGATGNVYAWGAQSEYGSAASDYTATTSATAVLQIADPFFQQAPSTVPGYQWNLNSLYPLRGRQIVITNTSNPNIGVSLPIYPGGTGSSRTKGLTLTASVYVKQQAASPPSVPFAISDGNFYDSGGITLTPGSSWQRNSVTHQFSAATPSSQTRFQVGGVGTSAIGTFYLFGAQLETESAASPYKYSASVSGVHTKCHFYSDELAHLVSEFNQNVFENSQRTRVGGSRLADVITIYESA